MRKQVKIVILAVLTSFMFLGEIFFGYYTHSIALVTDSFHMLSDVLALSIAYYAISLGKRKTWSKQYTYGWQRAETFGALVNATFLLALCFTIFLQAIQRIVEPVAIRDPLIVLIVGVLGLSVNCIGLLLFHNHAHAHDGDASMYTHGDAQQSKMNMRAVFLHVLGDALGSVGVVISAVIVKWTDWSGKIYVDPVVSLLIAALIVATTVPLWKKAAAIFLHIVPQDIPIENLQDEISTLQFVQSVHEFHVWQLDDMKSVASVHIVVNKNDEHDGTSEKDMIKVIKDILHKYNVHNTTIQLETPHKELHEDSENDCFIQCPENSEGIEDCGERACCPA